IAEHATTGDGELTALHLLQRMAETGRTARELKNVMTRLPQALINVKDVDKAKATIDRGVSDAIEAAEKELGEAGRGRLRPPGPAPAGPRGCRGRSLCAPPAPRRAMRRSGPAPRPRPAPSGRVPPPPAAAPSLGGPAHPGRGDDKCALCTGAGPWHRCTAHI